MEGLMLKLKVQYFGHLMQRADSLEKTLMLGKIEGKRRRERQRLRWLDGITNSQGPPKPLSITNSWDLLKLMSIELVMPSNHLILCRSLLLLPSIFPSIRVLSNESPLRIRWPKHWSFSFNISPSNKHPRLVSFRMISLQSKGLSRVFSNTTVQKHQFFGAQLSL